MREIFKLFGSITVNGLEGVQKGLKAVDSQFKAADKALTKFGRQSAKIGTTLSQGFTAPLAALGATIGIATTKTAEYAEELLNLQTVTGMSLKNLQEFKHVANLTGVSFDGLVGTIAKLTNKMAGIATEGGKPYDAIRRLGVSVYDTNGNVRDMNDLFPELISKLQGIQNPIERNATAMEIFGKSVGDIAPVLAMSADELAAMRREAHTLGLVMSDDAIAAADEFGDEVDKLKEQFTAIVRNLASGFIPILRDTIIPLITTKVIPAIQAVAGMVQSWINAFRKLDPATKNMILGVAGFLAVVGPMMLALGKTILLFSNLIKTIALVKMAFTGLTIAMASNPFTLIIAGLGILAGAFVAARMEMIAFQEEANKNAGIEGLKKGIEGLNKQYLQLSMNGKNLAEIQKAQAGATEDLVAMAEELGFIFNENNGSEREQLQNLRLELLATNNLAQAVKKFNKIKTERTTTGAGAPIGPTKEEIAESEKLISGYTEKAKSLTNTRMDDLNDEATAAIAAIKAMAGTAEQKQRAITEFNRYYATQRTQIIADEAKVAADKAKEAADARSDIESDYAKKMLEMNGESVLVLEMEKEEAIRIANEKGAETLQIAAYYDAKIAQEHEALKNKEKTYLGGTVKDWLGAFQQIGQGISDIFSMATDNRIAEVDNWENAERQAIERSTESERTKQKKIERLEQEAESKRMDIKKKAAKQSKAISIFESIIGTGSAVVGALGMKPWTPFNFIMAGIVGALGAAKTAMIAAQPLPFAQGGLVAGGQGGVLGQIGEGRQDELVMPMETGVRAFADRVLSTLGGVFNPQQGLALAGAGGAPAGSGGVFNLHVGTLVADDRGIKELERRMLAFRIGEQQRKGG